MEYESKLWVDGQPILAGVQGIKHQVTIDTANKTVTKRYQDAPQHQLVASRCFDNEVRFLGELSKYDFIPTLLDANREELTTTLQYVGEPIWDYGRDSGDPTFPGYRFAVKDQYKTPQVFQQVAAILGRLLLEEGVYAEFYINNFAISQAGKLFFVDFDTAERLPPGPHARADLEIAHAWWLERWGFWIPPAELANFARDELAESATLMGRAAESLPENILRAAQLIAGTFRQGGKALLLGNGGSAAEAEHLAGELVGRLKNGPLALPAIALTGNPALVTAIGNDRDFKQVFSQQVAALGRAGDVLVALSTSGDSANLLEALRVGRELGCKTIALTGPDGGQLRPLVDLCLAVPSSSVHRIQEAHLTIGHILCKLIDRLLPVEQIPTPASKPRSPVPLARRIEIHQARTYPIAERDNKVDISALARTPQPGCSFADFLDCLPGFLAATDLRQLVQAIAAAHRHQRAVAIATGAHLIKTGLSPVVIDLMQRGVVTSVALNGGGSIHDFELAYSGGTSEDVERGLRDGRFGMAEETGRLMNEALCEAWERDGPHFAQGMGELLGRKLLALEAPYRPYSLLAAGAELGIPVTVHVTIGADIIHMHPGAHGGAIGQATYNDFRRFAATLETLGHGGVYLNIGSAVVLPEVFLKALNLMRNLGYDLHGFTTANLDMHQHYRPLRNVVQRPTAGNGTGYALTGHHELMLPLLALAVLEEIARQEKKADE